MHNAHYDDTPDLYDDLRRGWMFLEKSRILYKTLEELSVTHGSILDFGCGTGSFIGEFSIRYPEIQGYGYDINPPYVQYAKEKYPDSVFSADINDFIDKPFNVLYVSDVIHHFPAEKDFFDFISPLSFRYLICFEPNQFNPYVLVKQGTMEGERNFRQNRFESEYKERGYVLHKKRYHFIYPSTIKMISPFFMKINHLLENNKILGGGVLYVLEKPQ